MAYVLNARQVRKDFEAVSGLALSITKTSCFSSGLSLQEISDTETCADLTHGRLSIRYISLALCTKKLTSLQL